MTKLNESRHKAVAGFSTRKREMEKAIYSNIFDDALKVAIPPGVFALCLCGFCSEISVTIVADYLISLQVLVHQGERGCICRFLMLLPRQRSF